MNTLSDQLMLHDMLTTEKQASTAFNTATIEASNIQISKQLCDMNSQIHAQSQMLFECMYRKGWYSVDPAHNNQAAQKQLDQQLNTQMKSTTTNFQKTGML